MSKSSAAVLENQGKIVALRRVSFNTCKSEDYESPLTVVVLHS